MISLARAAGESKGERQDGQGEVGGWRVHRVRPHEGQRGVWVDRGCRRAVEVS